MRVDDGDRNAASCERIGCRCTCDASTEDMHLPWRRVCATRKSQGIGRRVKGVALAAQHLALLAKACGAFAGLRSGAKPSRNQASAANELARREWVASPSKICRTMRPSAKAMRRDVDLVGTAESDATAMALRSSAARACRWPGSCA